MVAQTLGYTEATHPHCVVIKKWKRLNWDLHAVGGFYVHLVLLAISLTGLVFGYPWFSNLVYQLADSKPAPKKEAPANITKAPIKAGFYESLYEQANAKLPYKGRVTILLPEKENLSITVNKLNREAAVDNVIDVLYFEKRHRQFAQRVLVKNSSTGNKIRRMNLPIHTGKLFGWPTLGLVLIAAYGGFLAANNRFLNLDGKKKEESKGTKNPLRAVPRAERKCGSLKKKLSLYKSLPIQSRRAFLLYL